jgi:hypothetical protein
VSSLAVPVLGRLLADLFCLDLKTDENPDGTLSFTQIYKALSDCRSWMVSNSDPKNAWNIRRRAAEGASLLIDSSKHLVEDILRDNRHVGWTEAVYRWVPGIGHKTRRNYSKEGSLRWYGRHFLSRLLRAGKCVEEVTDIAWLTALGGIGVPVCVVS